MVCDLSQGILELSWSSRLEVGQAEPRAAQQLDSARRTHRTRTDDSHSIHDQLRCRAFKPHDSAPESLVEVRFAEVLC